jgi:hypothetical protein
MLAAARVHQYEVVRSLNQKAVDRDFRRSVTKGSVMQMLGLDTVITGNPVKRPEEDAIVYGRDQHSA